MVDGEGYGGTTRASDTDLKGYGGLCLHQNLFLQEKMYVVLRDASDDAVLHLFTLLDETTNSSQMIRKATILSN